MTVHAWTLYFFYFCCFKSEQNDDFMSKDWLVFKTLRNSLIDGSHSVSWKNLFLSALCTKYCVIDQNLVGVFMHKSRWTKLLLFCFNCSVEEQIAGAVRKHRHLYNRSRKRYKDNHRACEGRRGRDKPRSLWLLAKRNYFSAGRYDRSLLCNIWRKRWRFLCDKVAY